MDRPAGEYVRISGKPKGSTLITQANVLAKASYVMSWQEKMLMWWIIWGYQKDQSQHLTITVQEFARWAKTNGSGDVYERTRLAAEQLRSRNIYLPLDNDRVGVCGLLRYAEYGEDRSGEIEVVITDEILPFIERYIEDVGFGFTKHRAKVIASLKTFKGHRLNEYVEAESFGARGSKGWFVSVDDLRQVFGCLVKDKKGRVINDEYREWRRFRSKVLDPAVKEANERAAFDVSYEMIRSGRSVSGIRMKAPKKAIASGENSVSGEAGLASEMRKLGTKSATVADFLEKYGTDHRERITLALDATKRRVKAGGVGSPAGLFVFLVNLDLRVQRDLDEVLKSDAAEAAADVNKRGPADHQENLRTGAGFSSLSGKFKEKKLEVVK